MGVEIRKFDESFSMFKINVVGDHNFNIDETTSPQVKMSVAEMINNYKLLKIKTTYVVQ